MNDASKLIKQAGELLTRLEQAAARRGVRPPTGARRPRFAGASATARERSSRSGTCIASRLKDLQGIDAQKQLVEQNTRQFVEGHPANNVLLTGARGTGKSSLIKALLNKYAAKGLRLIEVEKQDLVDLADIVDRI